MCGLRRTTSSIPEVLRTWGFNINDRYFRLSLDTYRILADCPCEVYRNAIGAMTKRCPEAKERLLSCDQIRRFVEDHSVQHEMGSLSVIDVTGEGMGGHWRDDGWLGEYYPTQVRSF